MGINIESDSQEGWASSEAETEPHSQECGRNGLFVVIHQLRDEVVATATNVADQARDVTLGNLA